MSCSLTQKCMLYYTSTVTYDLLFETDANNECYIKRYNNKIVQMWFSDNYIYLLNVNKITLTNI